MHDRKLTAMSALPAVAMAVALAGIVAFGLQTLLPTQVDGARGAAGDGLPTPASAGDFWRPALTTSWQLQLLSRVDLSVDASMYVIDLFDNDSTDVSALQARGRKVVCYFSAGAWEDWRPDAGRFSRELLGRSNGWPGERWLDIRRLDLLGPIMEERMDLCKAKGFNGVDPDNVDGYLASTGFPLTYEDQLRFNSFIANAAHARGLAVGLKNDLPQIRDLLPYFEWAINEQCFEHGECELLLPFIEASKPVFHVEYALETRDFCPQANTLNFNSMKKKLQLDAYREPCR